MKLAKSTTRTITLDSVPNPEMDGGPDPYADDLSPYDAPETGAQLCPVCHDLLAWHEQTCEVAATPQATTQSEPEAPAAPVPTSAFAFAIGHRVQPTYSAPAAITWRGQHKERHPATGLVHRINVYYLDNGYWDCYREDELQVA